MILPSIGPPASADRPCGPAPCCSGVVRPTRRLGGGTPRCPVLGRLLPTNFVTTQTAPAVANGLTATETSSRPRNPEGRGHRAQLLDQPVGVTWDRDEVVMRVEPSGVFVDSVDDHHLAAGNLRCFDNDRQCQDQKFAPEAAALDPTVESELSQEDRWHLARRAPTYGPGHLLSFDHVRSKREVSDDLVALIDDHVGPSALPDCMMGVDANPVAEDVVAAVEGVDRVGVAQ